MYSCTFSDSIKTWRVGDGCGSLLISLRNGRLVFFDLLSCSGTYFLFIPVLLTLCFLVVSWTIQLDKPASHILYHPSTLQFLVSTSTASSPTNLNNSKQQQQQQHGLYLFSSVVDSSSPRPLWIGLPAGSGLGTCRGLALYRGTQHDIPNDINKEHVEEDAFVVYFDASLYTPVIINIQTGAVMSIATSTTTNDVESANEMDRVPATPSSSSFILSRLFSNPPSHSHPAEKASMMSGGRLLQTMPDGEIPLLLQDLCGMASHVALAPSKIVGTALASGLTPRRGRLSAPTHSLAQDHQATPSALLQNQNQEHEHEDVIMDFKAADDNVQVDANGNLLLFPKPTRDININEEGEGAGAGIEDYSFLTGLFTALIVEGGRGGGGGGSRSVSSGNQPKQQVIR